MLDREVFVRPIAHRGLHAAETGVVENAAAAFSAAVAHGYGIECDLQPSSEGVPIVFHDKALARLVDAPGVTTDHAAATLRSMAYRGSSDHILLLDDLLHLVAGRVAMLVEIKSSWSTPHPGFLANIAKALKAYRGPAAVMSFDPDIVASLRELAPGLPRGIVSGIYDRHWLPAPFDRDRAWRLSHLVDSRAAAPDFVAYHVTDLPTPVTRFLREGLGMPLFAWTVREETDLRIARQWSDAPIFETIDPTTRFSWDKSK